MLVGIEVHQQLDISTKLFCACPPVKSEEFPYRFERRLRPSHGETGRVDPAAVFEYTKGRSNMYFWNPESSCLVEADEEPPHAISREGLEAALIVAATLGSRLVDEVHVMRKIVIDGSNTGGFQRTAVVGLGGSYRAGGARVGVQSVTLEEDAARILGEDEASRRFALDRLGVALVEIALDPVPGDPDSVARVALHLGRILRSTRRVARGLGTIRQDLNVSLSGGNVVEVKGVQKLNLLPRVIEYEGRRQSMLLRVAKMLREKGTIAIGCRSVDVTRVLASTQSRLIAGMLKDGGKVFCIVAPGLAGLIGLEPEQGVRLGKELAEVARANSLGGVIHSDEFEKQGLSGPEREALSKVTGAGGDDALVLVAGPPRLVERVVPLLEARLEQVPAGVPAETRAATDTGETRYMRPRPGSQRMYPETDIPDIVVDQELAGALAASIPVPWTETVERLIRSYSLSDDLALKLYDSDLTEGFEDLAKSLALEPSFVAATVVDLPVRLGREGVPESALGLPAITEALEAVDSGKISKEAVPDVLKTAGERRSSVSDAIAFLGLGSVSEADIIVALRALVAREAGLLSEKGHDAFSQLMGEAMKELRGKADGRRVAELLRTEMKRSLDARQKGP